MTSISPGYEDPGVHRSPADDGCDGHGDPRDLGGSRVHPSTRCWTGSSRRISSASPTRPPGVSMPFRPTRPSTTSCAGSRWMPARPARCSTRYTGRGFRRIGAIRGADLEHLRERKHQKPPGRYVQAGGGRGEGPGHLETPEPERARSAPTGAGLGRCRDRHRLLGEGALSGDVTLHLHHRCLRHENCAACVLPMSSENAGVFLVDDAKALVWLGMGTAGEAPSALYSESARFGAVSQAVLEQHPGLDGDGRSVILQVPQFTDIDQPTECPGHHPVARLLDRRHGVGAPDHRHAHVLRADRNTEQGNVGDAKVENP